MRWICLWFCLAIAGGCPAGDCDPAALLQVHPAKVNAAATQQPKCTSAGKYGLVVVDMQNDFVEKDGSLPVGGAEELIPIINKLVTSLDWDVVTFTEDFHPQDHVSFAVNSPFHKQPFDFVTLSYDKTLKLCGSEYNKIYGPMAHGKNCTKDETLVKFEQELWPAHCIQNTHGQRFHEDLTVPSDALIVRKGVNSCVDSYGAFYDNIGMHIQNDTNSGHDWIEIETGMHRTLNLAGITHLFLTGVAEDYCVKYTALQALKAGLGVYLITDATKPVSQATGNQAKSEMVQMGAKLIESCELLGDCDCGGPV